MVSSFAKQLIHIAAHPEAEKKVVAGDLSIIRDFVDVRDVVKAYYILLKEGKKGEVYNICSGSGISLQAIIGKMSSLLNLEIALEKDPALIRPNDNKIIIGSALKLNQLTGWYPDINIDQSLADIISWWKTNS